MWSSEGYRKLVRASGIYDLLIAGAFATPWTFALLHEQLGQLHQLLGFAGSLPAFDPVQVLLGNLMGSIICVWAWLRIRDPQRQFGRYDAVGRLLFATWQAYALALGATPVIALILVLELVWLVLQVWPVASESSAGQKMIAAL